MRSDAETAVNGTSENMTLRHMFVGIMWAIYL